jgi:hypothetical protein
VTSAELFPGRRLRTRLDFAWPKLGENIMRKASPDVDVYLRNDGCSSP